MSNDIFHSSFAAVREGFEMLKKAYDTELRKDDYIPQEGGDDLEFLSSSCDNICTLLELIEVCARMFMDAGASYGKSLSQGESVICLLSDDPDFLPEWFPQIMRSHIDEARGEVEYFDCQLNKMIVALKELRLATGDPDHQYSLGLEECLTHEKFEDLAIKGAKVEARNLAFHETLKPYYNLLNNDLFNEYNYRLATQMDVLTKVRLSLQASSESSGDENES